jgi:hypothetical protein
VARTAGERLTLAWLQGTVHRLVGYRDLDSADRAAAIAEVRAVTSRPELLAEVAGVWLGLAPSRPTAQDVDRQKRMAALLIEAGADETLLAQFTEVGRKRAAMLRPGTPGAQ